jgi:CheY-like chemotaxis protein
MRAAGRVLVIDDDPTFLATVQDLLIAERYIVNGATTVGAALDLLWQDWAQQPDAILLAGHLSAVNGEPFTELYHVLPVPHAPVLLVRGETTVDEEATASEAAPDGNPGGDLQKPVTRADVLACLQRACRTAAPEPAPQPTAA